MEFNATFTDPMDKMPDNPRITVHDYIDARLDEQDERLDGKFEQQDDKIERRHIENRIEIKELRGWFVMISAPAWADLVRQYTHSPDYVITVTFLFIVIGLIIIFFYRTRRPVSSDEKRG